MDPVDPDVKPPADAVPRVQARTRLARRAVVEAAREVFTEQGYGTARIQTISARSGVPAATVYRLFGSKIGILRAVVDVAIAGDDEDLPMLQRPQLAALLADPDPRRRVAGFVEVTAGVNTRLQSAYAALSTAAGSDPEAADLLADLDRQRGRGQSVLVASLVGAGELAPGLSEREAVDIVHALLAPDLYRRLVVDRGWPVTRYATWLTGVLTAQLLPP